MVNETGVPSKMDALLERARAHLAGLEADRQAASTLSEQKAEEAKLIKARQEGFQAAMEILCAEIPSCIAGPDRPVPNIGGRSDPIKPGRRRRRSIPQLIVRELSFSGHAMTAAQIANAIEYLPDRTKTALERMEKDRRVVRDEGGRWTIGRETAPYINGHTL
jgi:hypothetical protein